MNVGLYSYLGAATGFAFLSLLLFFSWRNSIQARLLTGVTVISAVWAGLAALVASGWTIPAMYRTFDILRYVAWYAFLLALLHGAARQRGSYRSFLRWALPLSIGFGALLLVAELAILWILTPAEVTWLAAFRITGHLLLALIGLAIIEQLFRNTSVSHRWAAKYLFIGAGGIFAYDFYLHADALLFRGMNHELWEVRGLVNLAAVPLVAIAAARNRDWSMNIFVSRDIVLNVTTLLFAGLYLLVMAGTGYYLREHGGNWGRLLQALFLALAVVLLAAVMFSGQLRAELRVFFGKHFYRNKYDYRHEWLALTGELSRHSRGGAEDYGWAIRVLGSIVDARAGLLWLNEGQGGFENSAAWQLERIRVVEPRDSALVRSLTHKGYLINLTEIGLRTGEYEGLDLPQWLEAVHHAWLIVPLFGLDSLMGFVVLANPLINRSINWEDRDLLKAAANQIATQLAVLMTSSALAEVRQFEVFNRLSAYMVHDLKNIAAELELVARNAKRHTHNPQFLDDAFGTVASASGEIRRLLEHLRNKRADVEKSVVVELAPLLREVIGKRQNRLPQPRLVVADAEGRVVSGKTRLAQVLTHLIDNAQQATAESGRVEVKLSGRDAFCIVEIRDTGCGMDADFVKNRLFRPFDTTKGNAGMGIGMYESRELIRELGGEIRVESAPGEGTLISLLIPAAVGRGGLLCDGG
jgi:putative PEP-CTERM system histidine kinase